MMKIVKDIAPITRMIAISPARLPPSPPPTTGPGWSNEEFDNLLMMAAASPTQQERFSYMYEAEKILIDEMPIIPIYTYTRIYMKHESVKGWSPNLLDSHPYQYVSISK